MIEDIEIRTVETILDKGVRVSVPTPFFLRLIGIKHFNVVVHRPTVASMLNISKHYVELKVDETDADWSNWMVVLARAGKPTTRIVAAGMLRGRVAAYLFARPLAWYLRGTIDMKRLADIASILVALSGVQDFMNTIKFLRLMKLTEPRNTSQ